MSALRNFFAGLFSKKTTAQQQNERILYLEDKTRIIGKILSLENETKIIIALREYIDLKIKQNGREKLASVEKTFDCVFGFESEINNGGLNQYFFNSAGNFALDTVVALQNIGANYASELLLKSFDVFPEKKPFADRFKRQEQLNKIGNEGEEFLLGLDEKLLAYHPSIGALLIKYVEKHKTNFEMA